VTVVDVLDRILDKGIVIDAWLMVSVDGVDLPTVEVRVVAASFETHLSYGERVSRVAPGARPSLARAAKAQSDGC
jgi:hypothetical protein